VSAFCEKHIRFWRMVEKGAPDECWLWLGSKSVEGYGLINPGRSGGTSKAHRVSYEISVGPIPDGLTIDHLCRTPGCVNPSHLEPVTHRENILRGGGWAAQNARKTHCVNDHEFTAATTRVNRQGKRVCRECHRVYSLAWYHAKKRGNAA
jgi:hypothetical protein